MVAVLLVPFGCWLILPKQQAAASPEEISLMVDGTARAIVAGTPISTNGSGSQSGFVGGIPNEIQVNVIPDTPTPTMIPTQTATPVGSKNLNDPAVRIFSLSFYDPDIYRDIRDPVLRDTNCLTWDDVLDDCVSKVHGGFDEYRPWYGKGAACTTEMPMDVVFEVMDPAELRGIWRCIDRGDLDVWKNDRWYHYIDFMLDYPEMIWTGKDLMSFPWSSDVVVKILSEP